MKLIVNLSLYSIKNFGKKNILDILEKTYKSTLLGYNEETVVFLAVTATYIICLRQGLGV
jgi:hypothetical protein